MFILYFGGQKSGKSKLAEQRSIKLSPNSKPYYVATYNNSYDDKEMLLKIDKHLLQRENKFITIEETTNLTKVIKGNKTYLVDCISMWLLNNLELEEDNLLNQIEELSKIKTNIIFVLNDVNNGVIPIEKLSRKFVDMTGIVGQKLASICDEVYEVKFGIGIQIK
jgi:adenosylcobinamide kinase/adenosylcobinamide-phosphate guanylyltransferase